MFSKDHLRLQNDFESRIESFAKTAYEKYAAAGRKLPSFPLSGRFKRFLKNQIVPELTQIGFNESICRTFFQIAAASWEMIGPIPEKNHWFHPSIFREIEEIKTGIFLTSKRYNESVLMLVGTSPKTLHALANEGMHPKNTLSLLDNVTTSWIILPRVYGQLEPSHCRYLMGYLKYLTEETQNEFKKLLMRIITEFIGNYTLKFMNKAHSKDRVLDVLFFGYEVMFWENLKNPPKGLENLEAYKHFFRWAKQLQKKFAMNSLKMKRAIRGMEEAMRLVFPPVNAFGLAPACYDDTGTFIIALRHGRPGTEAVIKSFGMGGYIVENKTLGLLPYTELPVKLSALFRKIKKNFFSETQTTQKFIKKFLLELKSGYESKASIPVAAGTESAKPLYFVKQRAYCLTKDIIESV